MPYPHGVLQVSLCSGHNLHNTALFGSQSPYVKLSLGNETHRSATISYGGTEPNFRQQTFKFHIGQESMQDLLHFRVKSDDTLSNKIIGRADLPVSELVRLSGQRTVHLVHEDNFSKPAGTLIIIIQFVPDGSQPLDVLRQNYSSLPVANPVAPPPTLVSSVSSGFVAPAQSNPLLPPINASAPSLYPQLDEAPPSYDATERLSPGPIPVSTFAPANNQPLNIATSPCNPASSPPSTSPQHYPPSPNNPQIYLPPPTNPYTPTSPSFNGYPIASLPAASQQYPSYAQPVVQQQQTYDPYYGVQAAQMAPSVAPGINGGYPPPSGPPQRHHYPAAPPYQLPPFHTQCKDSRHHHRLTLVPSVYNGKYICNQCRREGAGPAWHCAVDNFDLHPICLTHPDRPLVQADFRHPHSLTLTPFVYDGNYRCDSCKGKGHGEAWHCSLCKFDLHPQCIQST